LLKLNTGDAMIVGENIRDIDSGANRSHKSIVLGQLGFGGLCIFEKG